MKLLLYIMLIFSLCLRLAAESPAEQLRKREEFAQGELEKVMTLFHAGRRAEALNQVDSSSLLMEGEFRTDFPFYERIWSEAQLRSGAADEAWGLDLFLRLLKSKERKANAPGAGQEEPPFLLSGNIAGRLRSLGRVTEAREIVSRENASLASIANLDTVTRPYEDLGPLFPFLPDARKKKFPLMDMEDGPKPADGPAFYYPRIYAVAGVAQTALEIGDWVRAAELYRWVADYASIYCQRDLIRAGELSRYCFKSHAQLASICTLHGFPAEADVIYAEYIAMFSSEGFTVEDAAMASAKLRQLVIKAGLGTLPEDAVEIAENSAKIIAECKYWNRTSKFNTRIEVARIYYAKGNRTRAWEIIRELSTEANADVNEHYKIMILSPMIDFALEEGASHPELEKWLVSRLYYERSEGNKFGELHLYEQFAKFLMLNDRLPEALEIVQEAIRLSVAMNVPFRENRNRQLLDTIKELVEGKARKVDLQPMSSRSTVIPGSSAYGRFYLTNPSTVKKFGTLKMTGSIATISPITEGKLSLVLDAGSAVKAVRELIVMEPGASIVIDITGESASEDVETEFTCAWIEDTGPVSESIWLYKSSDTASRTSVVDAHAVRISPFHLVPIRHMVQRIGNVDFSESVDFKISSSEPMRIEVYDSSGTKLISVDANGDGDFLDRGDLVYQDINGNGHPDLTIGERETMVSLTMYVDPGRIGTDHKESEREVSICILADGEWHLDAVDVIRESAGINRLGSEN